MNYILWYREFYTKTLRFDKLTNFPWMLDLYAPIYILTRHIPSSFWVSFSTRQIIGNVQQKPQYLASFSCMSLHCVGSMLQHKDWRIICLQTSSVLCRYRNWQDENLLLSPPFSFIKGLYLQLWNTHFKLYSKDSSHTLLLISINYVPQTGSFWAFSPLLHTRLQEEADDSFPANVFYSVYFCPFNVGQQE